MIPTNDFLSSPYDDTKLEYSYDNHRYVFNIDAMGGAVGDDGFLGSIGGDDNAKWLADHISRATYQALKFYKDSKYYYKLEYILSHSKMFRREIYNVMKDILVFTQSGGGLYTAYKTWVNFNEMARIDKSLIDYIGNMANTIINNSGLAERILRYDLDRSTSFFTSQYLLLKYMSEKGYITLNDYFDTVTFKLDGSDFNLNKYTNVSENYDDFVYVTSPILFNAISRDFIIQSRDETSITFTFELSNYITLNNDGTLITSNATNPSTTDFTVYLTMKDQPIIPRSNKYMIGVDANGYWFIHEFGFFETEMTTYGSQW